MAGTTEAFNVKRKSPEKVEFEAKVKRILNSVYSDMEKNEMKQVIGQLWTLVNNSGMWAIVD